MLRFDRIRCSTQLGRYGTASSGMFACCGVRPPFFRLHDQARADDVLPLVAAALGNRLYVIAGQLAAEK